MNKLSFEPKFFVKNKRGEWALRNTVPHYLLADSLVEANKITDEGGVFSEFIEGQIIAEAGLSNGLVDHVKSFDIDCN